MGMAEEVRTAWSSRIPDKALVLIVEADPNLVRMIGKVLETEYRVASAANGDDGLRKAVVLQPDLILSDGLTPCLSGEGLLRAVRAHPRLSTVPFLLLMGQADRGMHARALSEGAQDYLMKPFSIGELRARVAIHVTLKRARDILQRELTSTSTDLEELSTEVVRRCCEAKTALRQRDECVKDARDGAMPGNGALRSGTTV